MLRKILSPWRDLWDLPRELWLIAFATFVNRAGTMVLPFMMLYLTRELKFTPAQAGQVLTVYGVVSLLIMPFSGRFADQHGAVRVMLVSLFITSLVLFLFPLAKIFSHVILMAVTLSIGAESFRPACLAAMTEYAPPQHVRRANVLLRLAINFGTSIGPALGGFFILWSFHFLFLIDGLTAFFAALIFLLRFNTKQNPKKQGTSSSFLRPFAVLKNRQLFSVLLAFLPITMVFFQNDSTLSLFIVDDLLLPATLFGFIFTINSILIILLEVQMNHHMAHWSPRRSLSLGAALFAVGYGSLYFATDFSGIFFMAVVMTFGEMILFPSLTTYIAGIAPEEERGQYMGFFMMAMSLGYVMAPLVGIFLRTNYGGRGLWFGMFLLGMISTALFLRVREPNITISAKILDPV